MCTCLPKCWGLSCDTCCHDDALQDKSVWTAVGGCGRLRALVARMRQQHLRASLCTSVQTSPRTPKHTHTHCLFTSSFFIVFLYFLFFLRFSTRFSKRAQPALRRCRFCRFGMQICLHENEGSCPDLPLPLNSSYSCPSLLLGIGAYAFHFTYA